MFFVISILRQISETGVPLSACRSSIVTCSGVNLLFRIELSLAPSQELKISPKKVAREVFPADPRNEEGGQGGKRQTTAWQGAGLGLNDTELHFLDIEQALRNQNASLALASYKRRSARFSTLQADTLSPDPLLGATKLLTAHCAQFTTRYDGSLTQPRLERLNHKPGLLMSSLWARLVVFAVVAIPACTSVEQSISPTESSIDALLTRLHRSSSGPRTKVAVPQPLRDLGCAAVSVSPAGFYAARISRSDLLALLGPLDSLEAPVIDGRPTLGSLHVVSGLVQIRGHAEPFTVNCLAQNSLSQPTFLVKLGQSREMRSLIAEKASLQPGNSGANPTIAASDLLLSAIRKNAIARTVSVPTADVVTNGGSLRPRRSFECGPGTDYACGSPTLPIVTVTATPGYPVVVDISMLYRDRRIYSLSEIYAVNYYGGPDCSNASETWIAINDRIQELEAYASDLETATSLVADQTCEYELTEGGNNLCIDLFIATERAGFILEGDDRTFDPNAPVKASRAQLYVNPADCSVRWVVNTTRAVSFGPFGGGNHAPHKLNRVETMRNDSGQCVVKWDLLNGFCQKLGMDVTCPAIEGTLTLGSDGSGGWTGNIAEDKYPSRGLYQWNGSGWNVISEREQRMLLDLFLTRQNIERLKIARDESLPSGCDLE